jgi:hypothetical protein
MYVLKIDPTRGLAGGSDATAVGVGVKVTVKLILYMKKGEFSAFNKI